MRISTIAATTALLAALPAFGGWFDNDDCRHTSPRRAATPITGITKVFIHAEAGSLKVDGAAGASQIVVVGTACTSEDGFLDRMTLTMRKSGSELHIDATIPRKVVFFGFFSAHLDFEVTVPAGMAVAIDDDSGWMKVANTGPTTIDDDSGSIEVRNVRGPLIIHDDSGSIEVDGVAGNLKIEDDSGDIIVKNVTGDVEMEDDSGGIEVAHVEGSLNILDDDSGSIRARNVKRDVTIDHDGSGSVEVADVGGDFTVGHKSSGHVDYERVAGKVSIPRRH